MSSDPTCIGSALLAQVDKTPDEDFILTPQGPRSWLSVAQGAAHARAFFAGQGIGAGAVVGVAFTDQVLTFEAIVALWSLGSLPVVIDFRSRQAELDHIRAGTGMDVIYSDLRPFQRKQDARSMAGLADAKGDLSDLTFPHGGETAAEIKTSSGVTGMPAIHVKSSERAMAAAKAFTTNQHRGAWGNTVSCLNLAFPGTRYLWYRNAVSGRKIISLPTFFTLSDLDAALRMDVAQEATLPPVLLTRLVQHVRSHHPHAGPRYPHLVKLQSIGGPLIGQALLDAKAVLSQNLVVTYSSTQTGVVSRLEGADIEAHPLSVGRPIADNSVTIDRRGLADADDGRSGVIVVQGPEKTVATDDLGYLDADGFLHITGRITGVLCRNGVSFHAEDVERQIGALDGVQACCVFAAQRGEDDNDVVLVAVELTADGSSQVVGAAISQSVSSLKCPDAVLFSTALPRTSGLKISRDALRRMHRETPDQFEALR